MTGDTEPAEPEVWITGVGLVTSLGEGAEAHWSKLANDGGASVVVDDEQFAPYPVHPAGDIDLSGQIPRRGDQRQMGRWQHLGTYAAGLALDDAGINGDAELCARTNLIVAAGSGEIDPEVDLEVVRSAAASNRPDASLNETLMTELRPTLFLAQLANLLAGNISIVHGVTGSSRSLMGEEMAGVSAVDQAWRRVRAGQGDLFLVGGSFNAEREDMFVIHEVGGRLWQGPYRPVWDRPDEGGGAILGSVGAFLTIESELSARRRGVAPYARIGRVRFAPDRSAHDAASPTELARIVEGLEPGPLAVLSGATGNREDTNAELTFAEALRQRGLEPALRAATSVIGHSVEAQFPAALALAAIAARHRDFYGPFGGSGPEMPFGGSPDRILVTARGLWRGAGAAIIAPV